MKTTHLLIGGLAAAAIAGFALSRPAATEPVSHVTPEPTAAADDMPPGHPAVPGASGDMPPGHPAVPGAGGDMPPGHPAVPGMGEGLPPGHAQAAGSAAADDTASLAWKVPAKWKEIPSPSSMRLATYRLPGSDEAECSVVRAGGSADANIDRWIGQFDEGSRASAKRSKTKVSGLEVNRLDIKGTFLGGGMMGGAPSEKKGWAMTGLVVETAGGTYFFKITGPEAAVKAAAPDVDALVGSLSPKK